MPGQKADYGSVGLAVLGLGLDLDIEGVGAGHGYAVLLGAGFDADFND